MSLSAELRAIEREIDNYHLSNLLTKRPFAEAAWYFLAFCEERVVHDIIRPTGDALHEQVAAADNLIVHSKTPLQWLRRVCPPGGRIPSKFDESLYKAAWQLSQLSTEYLSFESAFTYATLGLLSISVDANKLKTTGPMRNDTQYDAYDRFMDIHRLPSVELSDTSFMDRVAASVRVRNEWFDYDLNPGIVRAGLESLAPLLANRFVLPKDWRLPRFKLQEFERIANVLWVIAFIHFHARTIAAMRGCKGIGFMRALIVMEMSELINRLRRYSGVDESVVAAVVEDLTYASRDQSNPDLALQPIVLLSKSTVAISPNILMNSSMERNLTVLLNRLPTEKQVYSKLSKDRELTSRNSIINKLSDLGFRFWYGNVPQWDASSEIDLAIVSDVEQCCLILELKSFIGPAEAREIRDRSEEIHRGLEQTRKRMQMANSCPEPLRQILKITTNYKLEWGVASETSVGASYVQTADIPVVNAYHLTAYLCKERKLTKCTQWLRERQYLPKEGIDYQAIDIEAKIGRWILEWYGLRMLTDHLI